RAAVVHRTAGLLLGVIHRPPGLPTGVDRSLPRRPAGRRPDPPHHRGEPGKGYRAYSASPADRSEVCRAPGGWSRARCAGRPDPGRGTHPHRHAGPGHVHRSAALVRRPSAWRGRLRGHLPRAFTAAWTVLDWGPAANRLPYLPRVRYRRSILAPARRRLTTDDLPRARPGLAEWRQGLARWRERWACPTTVDLREDDRTLRLDLDRPLHAALLHAHLARHGHAILIETVHGFGWLDG